MVDYVAVLRRTIDALPKNTPEIRTRVYDKARNTIQSKLAMINPPPSQALIAKQMSGLDAAIALVEADFTVAVEAVLAPMVEEADPLADILNALPDIKPRGGRSDSNDIFSNADVFPSLPDMPPVQVQSDGIVFPDLPDRPRLPETSTLDFPGLMEPDVPERRAQDDFDAVFGDLPPQGLPRATKAASSMPSLDEPVLPPSFTRQSKSKAKPARVLLPLLGLALLGGAGALAWTEREQIIALLQPAPAVAVNGEANPPVTPETPIAPATTVPAVEPAANASQKFTQRLNPDGTEVDAGTGTSGAEQSVAQLEPATEASPVTEPPAVPATETPPGQPVTPAVEAPVTETPVTVTPADAIPVGQKAIFYEERTSGAEGSARIGAVVWSVVRESPGNDRPPEPAIRGELTIPELGLNVRMTLRRNADATLPASHILELIMSVPDDFSGGTIEDVQRVNLKPTEESAGAPLLATPVKVADKFFLVAMENTPGAQEANLALLRDQSWIDLPVVYRTGRRALFTMEKGLVGDQVFKQVLDAWVAAPLP